MPCRWLIMLLGLIALLAGGPVAAHLTPNSVVMLDFGSSRVAAEITVPVNELEFATGMRVTAPGDPVAIRYLAEHLAVRSPG